MKSLEFLKPNFKYEWSEASRMDKLANKPIYPELYRLGEDGWVETAKNGGTKTYSEIKNVLGNVDLDFQNLEQPKKDRFKEALINGKIETPIAVKFSDNDYDLVAGNTRLSGLVNNRIIDFPIWIVDISHLMENMVNENKIKGGKADKMSKKDIADKFNVTLSKIEKEIRTGVSIEKEHTGSATMAKEIAMDHLVEIPDYYTRLKKMEKEGETHWAKKMDESISDYLKRALRENIELTVVDETAISTDYDIYHNDRKCGLVTLSSHNSTLPKGAIELVIIQVAEKYRGLKLGYEVVKEIWKLNPDINKIFLMPTSQSRGFWDKMGAKRLNDTYSVIYKGHS